MTKRKLIECSICGETIQPHPLSGWAGGNNADPVNQGRCCDECDNSVVIPARIGLYLSAIHSEQRKAVK